MAPAASLDQTLHGPLGHLTPTEVVARCQVMITSEVAPV